MLPPILEQYLHLINQTLHPALLPPMPHLAALPNPPLNSPLHHPLLAPPPRPARPPRPPIRPHPNPRLHLRRPGRPPTLGPRIHHIVRRLVVRDPDVRVQPDARLGRAAPPRIRVDETALAGLNVVARQRVVDPAEPEPLVEGRRVQDHHAVPAAADGDGAAGAYGGEGIRRKEVGPGVCGGLVA